MITITDKDTNRRGVRMTKQRRVILETLRRSKVHPTADEVYAKVREELPRISLGTVYRNLQILEEMGEVKVIAVGGNQRRFDGTVENHYHVRCLQCGRVADMSIEPNGALEKAAQKASDFEITGHHLEFVGMCPGCRSGAARDGKKA
jgi:Fur family ferric uptake transcriptional regulator